MTQTTHRTDGMTDEQLADYYEQTHDLSEFDLTAPEPVVPVRQRLDVSITVRFTPDEIDALRATADEQGVKVTTLIRSLAVQHQPGGHVVDVIGARQLLSEMVRELSKKLGGGGLVSETEVRGRSTKQSGATAKKATPTRSATKASTVKKTVTTTKATPAKKSTPARSSDYGVAACASRKPSGGSVTKGARGTK